MTLQLALVSQKGTELWEAKAGYSKEIWRPWPQTRPGSVFFKTLCRLGQERAGVFDWQISEYRTRESRADEVEVEAEEAENLFLSTLLSCSLSRSLEQCLP